MIWHWPQITYTILVALHLLGAITLDGKPKEGNYNFGNALSGAILMILLLYSGGFWNGGCS